MISPTSRIRLLEKVAEKEADLEESDLPSKTAAAPTFSSALDKNPALKGKQSKLPDKLQASIIKKKQNVKVAGVIDATATGVAAGGRGISKLLSSLSGATHGSAAKIAKDRAAQLAAAEAKAGGFLGKFGLGPNKEQLALLAKRAKEAQTGAQRAKYGKWLSRGAVAGGGTAAYIKSQNPGGGGGGAPQGMEEEQYKFGSVKDKLYERDVALALGSAKAAAKAAEPNAGEVRSILAPRTAAAIQDKRSKREMIDSFHKNVKSENRTKKLRGVLSVAGLGSGLGMFLTKNPAALKGLLAGAVAGTGGSIALRGRQGRKYLAAEQDRHSLARKDAISRFVAAGKKKKGKKKSAGVQVEKLAAKKKSKKKSDVSKFVGGGAKWGTGIGATFGGLAGAAMGAGAGAAAGGRAAGVGVLALGAVGGGLGALSGGLKGLLAGTAIGGAALGIKKLTDKTAGVTPEAMERISRNMWLDDTEKVAGAVSLPPTSATSPPVPAGS